MQPLNLPRYSFWQDLPEELFQFIFSCDLTFETLSAIACVSKQWQRLVEDNSVGAKFIQKAELRQEEGEEWMKVYRCSNTQYIIALDVSASMEERVRAVEKQELALQRIDQITSRLEENIKHRGIYCAAFANKVIIQKIFSVKDIKPFFISNRYECGGGTNLTKLFRKVLAVLEADRKKFSSAAEFNILSDFEDHGLSLEQMLASSNIKINSLRIGQGIGERIVAKLKDEYLELQNDDGEEDTEELELELEHTRCYTGSSEEDQDIFDAVEIDDDMDIFAKWNLDLMNKKRKREAFGNARNVELSFAEVDLPAAKRQKKGH